MEIVVNFLTVFNPTLGDQKSDSDDAILDQILCFVSTQNPSTQTKIRTVGLIQGINEFSKTFATNAISEKHDKSKNTDSSPLSIDVVSTQKEKIVVILVEKSFHIVLSIQNGENIQDLVAQILLSDLKQSYSFFKLYSGSFQKNLDFDRQSFESLLLSYYTNFIKNYTCFSKLCLNSYRKSQMILKFPDLINDFEIESATDKLRGFFIFNTEPDKVGLVHQSSKIDTGCMINLINWIELNNFLGSTNYTSNDYPYIPSNFPNIALSNISLNDVNLIYLTMNGVNQLSTGVTNLTMNGVNHLSNGVTQIHNGVNQISESISSYLPMPWVISNATSQIMSDTNGTYLIGSHAGKITNKILYMTENGQDLEYKIIIYYKDEKLIILLYDSTYEELNNVAYYDDLSIKLNKVLKGDNFENRSLPSVITNFKFDNYYVIYDSADNTYISTLPSNLELDYYVRNNFTVTENTELFVKNELNFSYVVNQGEKKILIVKKNADNSTFNIKDFKTWFKLG